MDSTKQLACLGKAVAILSNGVEEDKRKKTQDSGTHWRFCVERKLCVDGSAVSKWGHWNINVFHGFYHVGLCKKK